MLQQLPSVSNNGCMPHPWQWPEHNLSLTSRERGLHIEQNGNSYLAREWRHREDLLRLVNTALTHGFSCVIRHSHPKPNNRDERGIHYIGFSRAPEERWAFVVDQYSRKRHPNPHAIAQVTFEKSYRQALERHRIPFEQERAGGHNLFVPFDRALDAIGACALYADLVEDSLGTRHWEAHKASVGFITEALLQSYLVLNWTETPALRRLEYLNREVPVDSGFIDILARDTENGSLVVVELKRDVAGPAALDQVARYVRSRQAISLASTNPIRAIIIARSFSEDLRLRVQSTPFPVELLGYKEDAGRLDLHVIAPGSSANPPR